MKRTWWIAAALVCLLCLLAPGAWGAGASVTLEWDPNSETDLSGYRIYWGTAPREPAAVRADNPYPHAVDAGNVTVYTVPNLPDGTLCFAATAYNTSGAESEFSNEVCTIVNSAPPAVPGLRLKRVTVTSTVEIAQ